MTSALQDLRRVDLNLLVAFDVLMAERNVSRAAARLCLGQSAMSSTLGRLRRHFDDPILVRNGRSMVPTAFAESLERPAREALASVQAVLSPGVDFDPTVDAREFTVMASEFVVLTLLRPLLVKLQGDAPHVRLRLLPVSDEYEEALWRDSADLVVAPSGVFSDDVRYQHAPLFRDEWVCIVDASNSAVGDEIALGQLQTLPYLATTVGSGQSFGETQLDRLGVHRQVGGKVALGIAPFLVPGTNLIALVPRRLASLFLDITPIRIVRAPAEIEPLDETLLWARRNSDDPGHRWLRRQVTELARELASATG